MAETKKQKPLSFYKAIVTGKEQSLAKQPIKYTPVFGDLIVPLNGIQDTPPNSYAETLTYINCTGTDIIVCKRNGIKLTIRSESLAHMPSNYHGKFIVRSSIYLNIDVKNHLLDSLSVATNLRSHEQSAIFDILYNQRGPRSTYNTVLDHVVDIDDIRNHNGTVYFTACDLLLTIVDDAELHHPYSDNAQSIAMLREGIINVGVNSLLYGITIVDNSGLSKEFFTNIHGCVYMIRSIQSHTLKDGIYFVKPDPVINISGSIVPVSESYPLDAAESMGIYMTMHDAKMLGDEANARKIELANAEIELQQSKLAQRKLEDNLRQKELEAKNAEFERTQAIAKIEEQQRASKLEHDREKLELERIVHQLKMEIDVRKSARDDAYDEAQLKRKADFEENQYRRKESSEAAKFMRDYGAAILTFGGALLLYLTRESKK